MSRTSENAWCNCGGIEGPHKIGEERCFRELIPESEKPTPKCCGFFNVPGVGRTHRSALHTWGWKSHPGGEWSRPKSRNDRQDNYEDIA